MRSLPGRARALQTRLTRLPHGPPKRSVQVALNGAVYKGLAVDPSSRITHPSPPRQPCELLGGANPRRLGFEKTASPCGHRGAALFRRSAALAIFHTRPDQSLALLGSKRGDRTRDTRIRSSMLYPTELVCRIYQRRAGPSPAGLLSQSIQHAFLFRWIAAPERHVAIPALLGPARR